MLFEPKIYPLDCPKSQNIEFSLAEQLEKVISVMNVKAREKNIPLYVNFSPSLNRLHLGDPLRVNQIMMNLISNAVKFTETGSVEVDITDVTSPNKKVALISLKVSDTGIGIPANKIGVIFEKFTQAELSFTRRFGGSGLGLSITRALVESMGGIIQVESEVGVGTTFVATIPLEITEKFSSIESFSASAAPTVPKEVKDVLLVEDYEPNLIVAGALLDNLGYTYEVARNGFEALRKFMHGNYDAILMDVQMDELDGLEAARRIRRLESDRELPRTPIIAMTAHVRGQDKDMCLEAGMDDFIPKPFDPQVLSQMLGRFVRQGAEMQKLKIVAQADNRGDSSERS